ncbi:hypothetical protein DACRYDRAFT_106026 [Dacryopinax primogenitus]|uniref:PI-PLC Y-box domain-containing protein n=1 Tax=Dacryopinax primogenitus (strain DJM 731) TaxID=1858805 RepID=M5G5B7_DACPD|nr:uncharacterized protein DACRYDRAFT_106026 [Dacryopinax primogenitus]EJU03869.1 hypothetical protein DACRYDRAFT_106026 [Dacryopinax primogenitus]
MPSTHPSPNALTVQSPSEPEYFPSLFSFEQYMLSPSPLPPALPLRSRPTSSEPAGKLVICHDMAGNYPKDQWAPMWSFPWWSKADVFIYFSHYRVGSPPRAWINAGHRQGCQVLGVLIFEPGNGEEDQYRLFLTPQKTLETKYADLLVELARQRGFDGWLVNLELRYYSHVSLLVKWLEYLTTRARHILGEKSCIMWFDSITTWGWRSHQNTLTHLNAPFFQAANMLHTNYWYTPSKIRAAETYLSGPGGRLAQDVAFGIDMWGRRTFKGGGYRACLALDEIRPQGRKFSTSLFAPAWLWESGELYPASGNTRQDWWDRETLFWVGRSTPVEEERNLKRLNTDKSKQLQKGERFQPISRYFPPKPLALPVGTTFSLGLGESFNVHGERVLDSPWSDHELVAPLPGSAMPASLGRDMSTGTVALLTGEVVEDPELAWFGAHCFRLSLPEDVEGGRGRYFAPLFPVVCDGEGEGCVLVAEVTWTTGTCTPPSPSPSHLMGWSASASDTPLSTECVPVSSRDGKVQWNKTTTVFPNLQGLVNFGIVVDFGQPGALFLGAVHIRRAVLFPPIGQTPAYVTPRLYCDSPRFSFSDGEDCGVFTWRTRMGTPPEASRSEEEPVLREITVSVHGFDASSERLCWGTTSLDCWGFSWTELEARRTLQELEEKGGWVEITVRLIDWSGYWLEGARCALRVLLMGRKVLDDSFNEFNERDRIVI